MVSLLLACGGCSYQLDRLADKSDKTNKADPADITGTLKPVKTSTRPVDRTQPTESDLSFAKAAAAEVLDRNDPGTSLPWENPQTGAKGTVTPIAAAYSRDGFTCRDFLASYLRDSAESWLQGEACRVHQGKWEVKSMRPWKRT